MGRSQSGLPDEQVKQTLENGKRETEELCIGNAEAESLIDQKAVERVETADDECLAEDHHGEQPR